MHIEVHDKGDLYALGTLDGTKCKSSPLSLDEMLISCEDADSVLLNSMPGSLAMSAWD